MGANGRWTVSKRILDLAITLPLLAVLSPLLALIALAIKLTSPGPVLFRQTRIGLDNRPFVSDAQVGYAQEDGSIKNPKRIRL